MNHRPRTPADRLPEIDFIGIYYSLRARWRVMAICLGAALVGGVLFVLFAPRIYTGEAVVQVEQSERKVVKIDSLSADDMQSMEYLKTLEQNLSGWTVLERVVRDPKLKLTPSAFGLNANEPLTEDQLIY